MNSVKIDENPQWISSWKFRLSKTCWKHGVADLEKASFRGRFQYLKGEKNVIDSCNFDGSLAFRL
jgi:hypothetical protein